MKKAISPSILSADFSRLGEEIRAVAAAGADYIHIDVMDGHFVPNITIGPLVVEAARRVTDVPLDVHLMIENADAYIDAFARAGSAILTVHAETGYHLQRTLRAIRDRGMKAGVSLNPATPLSAIEYVLDDVDMILIMTVNPGFGGQQFIPAMLHKIRRLRDMLDSLDYDIAIEVDGGIVVDNIAEVCAAGADMFVSGSGIFKTPDYAQTIAADETPDSLSTGRTALLTSAPAQGALFLCPCCRRLFPLVFSAGFITMGQLFHRRSMRFTVEHSDAHSEARAGMLSLPHGDVPTPVFMPVGTQGTVKAMTMRDIEDTDARIILNNTYHLFLRPGLELLEKAGGLHRFIGWQRPILTDSGRVSGVLACRSAQAHR